MEKIGRYRIVRRLGAGSFATVFLGHDDSLDVPVAVKVLAENWSANEDVRQRFLAEARIMRKIRDKRIVQVYDIGTLEDGRPYFVMDFIDGGSLDDLRKQRVEPERALRLCAEACRALQVLHDNDIIHRDVTPGNLLISRGPSGETLVLVADLGVAKSMIDAVGATMTAGTPSYMAMEQATGIGVLDHRADVYSLCALTYSMLTGEPPFKVRSLADILGRNAQSEPEKIADRLGAPPILDALMVSGLATDPQRRPPSAAVLGQALDSIADQMHTASAEVSPLPDSTTLRPSPATSYPQSPTYSPGSTPPIHSGDTPTSMIGQPGTGLPPGQSLNPGQSMNPGQSLHPGQSMPPGQSFQPGQTFQPGQSMPPNQTFQSGQSMPPAQTGYGYGSPGTQVPDYPTSPGTQYGQGYGAPNQAQPPAALDSADQGRKRPTMFYVLIGLGALALFALTLFITITALNS